MRASKGAMWICNGQNPGRRSSKCKSPVRPENTEANVAGAQLVKYKIFELESRGLGRGPMPSIAGFLSYSSLSVLLSYLWLLAGLAIGRHWQEIREGGN